MILGLGVDMVDHARVRAMLERVGADRLYRRLLGDEERAYCERVADPVQHIAARLAAKEAAFKALSGTIEARGIGWKEIETVHDAHRRPHLRLTGRARQRADELGVVAVHLSLSHSDLGAIAFVVIEGDGRVP